MMRIFFFIGENSVLTSRGRFGVAREIIRPAASVMSDEDFRAVSGLAGERETRADFFGAFPHVEQTKMSAAGLPGGGASQTRCRRRGGGVGPRDDS